MRPGSVILTQEGMVFGTPEFMSPEQAQGKALTPASDIYSLAVILYEVLTGKLPFDAKSAMDYIQLHVTGRPILLNQRAADKTFPPLLEHVIDRALAKRAEDRFATAADFASAMQQVLQGASQLTPQLEPKGNELPTMQGIQPAGTNSLATTLPQEKGEAALPPSTTTPLLVARARLGSPKTATGYRQGTNVPLLVGIALAFMLLGVGLAIALMRFVR